LTAIIQSAFGKGIFYVLPQGKQTGKCTFHHYHDCSLNGFSISKESNSTLLASSRAFAEVFKELAIAAEVLRRLAESYVSKSSPEEAQNALGSALSSMGYEANEFPRDVSNSPVDSTWGEIYLRISSSIHLLSTTKASRHLLTTMISPGHICARLIVTSISSQI
jgi:hypothetical protein